MSQPKGETTAFLSQNEAVINYSPYVRSFAHLHLNCSKGTHKRNLLGLKRDKQRIPVGRRINDAQTIEHHHGFIRRRERRALRESVCDREGQRLRYGRGRRLRTRRFRWGIILGLIKEAASSWQPEGADENYRDEKEQPPPRRRP